jgi:hypothetical protein
MLAQRGPFSRTRARPANAPTQAETTSWQAAVASNGGTVSPARFQIVNNFIYAEKAAGTWALTDDYWGLWAEDTPGALTSLKQLRMALSISAPSFLPSRGYQFDGATNYLRTGFIPSTNAVAASGTSGHLCAYVLAGTSGGFDIGNSVSSTVNWSLRSRNGTTNMTYSLNSTSSAAVSTVLGGPGFFCGTRTVDTFEGWMNGASVGQFVPTTFPQGVLPSIELYIGAQNVNAVPGTFSPRLTGFLAAGASLNAAQNLARYANVQAWGEAIGASA